MQPGSIRTASGTCSSSYHRLNSASRPDSTVARTLSMCSGNMSTLIACHSIVCSRRSRNEALMSLGDIRNLDYTILLCSHMQETREFYRDVMGFSLVHDSERWVSFQVGSALLT